MRVLAGEGGGVGLEEKEGILWYTEFESCADLVEGDPIAI